MNKYVYDAFVHTRYNVASYVQNRTEFDSPIDQALHDIFFYSHYDDPDEKRLPVIQAVVEGYIRYQEKLPQHNVDLMRLTEKGKDYIKARMDFDEL